MSISDHSPARGACLAIGLAVCAVPAAAHEIGARALLALPPADVVVLGEVHDNPVHHANQAVAVAALAPRALVFEMLSAEQAARVTPESRATQAGLAEALDWANSGWPDFAMYYPIFAAAPQAAIYGAAIARDDLRRVRAEGVEAVFGDDAARYGLTTPLPEDQQAAREALHLAVHCDALSAEALPGMVMAQRLRDAALARAVVAAYEETGGPVAVITGSGHARTDWGIPAALAQAAPELTVLSIGQTETPGADQPYDLWIVTEPAQRDDPCAAFAK